MAIYQLGDLVPAIDPEAYVHPDAVIIGDVHIGEDSSVWPLCVIRGDVDLIRIGAYVAGTSPATDKAKELRERVLPWLRQVKNERSRLPARPPT